MSDKDVLISSSDGATMRVPESVYLANKDVLTKHKNHQPTTEDAFRPRRTRTRAQMKELIASGAVRDPHANPEEETIRTKNTTLFKVPVGKLDAAGNTQENER